MSTTSSTLPQKFPSDRSARQWISGFLLLGALLGVPGSLLIVWQYHINTDPQLIGYHFLALGAGYVAAVALTQQLLPHIALRALALGACALASISLMALTFLMPPVAPSWRMVGLALLGSSAGTLATALLYLLSPYFAFSPVAMTNVTGVLFGWGCLASTLIVSITYFAGSVQIETGLLAGMPLLYCIFYAVNKLPAARERVARREEERRQRETLRDVRSIGALLFALLVFFQFGNEWAIAGWLPLFLIHRLGVNPVWAIFALAAYFLVLMMGRLLAQPLLASRHRGDRGWGCAYLSAGCRVAR